MKGGFIGLGIMGRPMAEHLLEKGTDLIVSDVNPDAVAVFTEKGAEEGSYTKFGEQCGIVFLMVPTGAISQSILFGEGGVAYALE